MASNQLSRKQVEIEDRYNVKFLSSSSMSVIIILSSLSLLPKEKNSKPKLIHISNNLVYRFFYLPYQIYIDKTEIARFRFTQIGRIKDRKQTYRAYLGGGKSFPNTLHIYFF